MKLYEVLLMLEEIEPKIGIKYEPSEKGVIVKMVILKLLTIQKTPLKQFWDQREKRKIVDQFVKSTFTLGEKMGIKKSGSDWEHFQEIAEELSYKDDVSFDVMFDVNPDFDLEKNKISLDKVQYNVGTGSGHMQTSWRSK